MQVRQVDAQSPIEDRALKHYSDLATQHHCQIATTTTWTQTLLVILR